MRVAVINAVPYGSTGKIAFGLADALQQQGHKTLCTAGFTWSGCSREDFFLTSNLWEKTLHTLLAKLTGRIGTFSRGPTRRLLRRLDAFSPDLVHLHNLHGWFLNLPMLFSYLRERGIPVVWTLHDCWSFTGHCPHFDAIGCEKWKTGCHDCPQYRAYPGTFFDFSRPMYENKRRWFTGLEELTLVTPSRWLAARLSESFLSDYPVEVIPNGVDRRVFCRTESDVRDRLGLGSRHLVLGVSYAWNERKGLDVFCRLAEELGDGYAVLLVGVDESVRKQLPACVLSIARTADRRELAELYSACAVFVNPTREDTYPSVNMEALSCGAPVVGFDVGGSSEIFDSTCGVAVARDDVDALTDAVRWVCTEAPFSPAACLACAERHGEERQIARYLDLYRRKCEREEA